MTKRTDKSANYALVLLLLVSALMLGTAIVLSSCTDGGASKQPSQRTTTTTYIVPLQTSTTTKEQGSEGNDPITDPLVTTSPSDVPEVITSDVLTTEPSVTPEPEPEPEPEPILMERGSKSDEVKALQNRLIELNFLWDKAYGTFGQNTEKAVKVFQKYAGFDQTGKVTQSLLDLLYSEDAPIAEVTYDHEDVLDPDYESDYYIIVYNDNCRVLVLGKDDFGKYNVVVKTFICSVGIKAEDDEGTPAGLYDIEKRYEWRTLFGHNGYKYVYGQYATRFEGNYLFHSVPYIKSGENNSLEMEEFEKLGTAASAGCVRLCVRDAKWIHDNAVNGTFVRVIDGKNGPEEYESIPALSYEEEYYGWDPTDPSENNPYRKENEE